MQQTWVQDKPGKYPSTGIIGVILGLHYCNHLNVHGFGPNKKNVWGHYFEKLEIKPGNNQHDASKEQEIIQLLHQQHSLKFYSHLVEPWWDKQK